MQIKNLAIKATAAIIVSSCNNETSMKTAAYKWPDSIAAPGCEKKPKHLIAHGDTRIDNYYWLNDYFKKGPDSTRVVDYLTAENKYYDTMMSGTLLVFDWENICIPLNVHDTVALKGNGSGKGKLRVWLLQA